MTWLANRKERNMTEAKTWEMLALGAGAVFLAAREPLEPPCEKPDGIGLLEHEPMRREDYCPGPPQTRLLATGQPAWLNFYHLIGVPLIPDSIGQLGPEEPSSRAQVTGPPESWAEQMAVCFKHRSFGALCYGALGDNLCLQLYFSHKVKSTTLLFTSS